MKVKFVQLEKKHLLDVHDLLDQEISKYKPLKRKINSIWSKLSKQKNSYYIIAKNKKELIGFGNLNIFIKARGNPQGAIEDIAVKDKFKKKGIGMKIVRTLIKIAKKKNCYKVILQTPKKSSTFIKKLALEAVIKACKFFLNKILKKKVFNNDKKTLYLHIGYPRTATKTLQTHFFPDHPDINYLGRHPKRRDLGPPHIDIINTIIAADNKLYDSQKEYF